MMNLMPKTIWSDKLDGLVQLRCNSIANALELHLSSTNPLICGCLNKMSEGFLNQNEFYGQMKF